MTLRISTSILDAIRTHAASSREEVCGLLLGDSEWIVEARACANVHPEAERFFELDPAALIAAHRAARAGGPAIVGHYHSHPSGRPEPSTRDAADAAPDGAIWLIVAGGEVRGWRATGDGAWHRRFEAVPLVACAHDGEPPEGAHSAR